MPGQNEVIDALYKCQGSLDELRDACQEVMRDLGAIYHILQDESIPLWNRLNTANTKLSESQRKPVLTRAQHTIDIANAQKIAEAAMREISALEQQQRLQQLTHQFSDWNHSEYVAKFHRSKVEADQYTKELLKKYRNDPRLLEMMMKETRNDFVLPRVRDANYHLSWKLEKKINKKRPF